VSSILQRFHPAVSTWFEERFSTPTEAQALGWTQIADGNDTLIMAPTGSGKTLAAFLAGLDRLVRRAVAGALDDKVRIVYVSPLKALGADVERNLLGPLRGIEETSVRLGRLLPPIRTALRTGDTTAAARAKILRRPPHILITTPESLYLLLTSAGGRAILGDVESVIVDEVHALVGNKRGAHLALSLERLAALVEQRDGGQAPPPMLLPGTAPRLQRVGLSATVEPPAEAARFLVGVDAAGATRPCALIDAGRRQPLDLLIEVPEEPLGAVASMNAWGDIYKKITAYVAEHRSTLIFVPSRRLAERVAHHLEPHFKEALGSETLVAAHHGALSKRTRLSVERRLQSGELRAVVATASLELGIDVGHVDLVCQIGSPRAISVLRQRIGRARHTVGGTPKGRIFALTRDELIETMAGVRAMRAGRLDRPVVREAPLDVLAQQLVATAAASDWNEDGLYALVRGAAPYAALPRARFDQVLGMLGDGISTRRGRAGAHLHLDRVARRVRGRRGARIAALTSGGAIPDKADYTVIEEPTDTVVGTLDEDFAIESQTGDIFLLGSTSWKVRRVLDGQVRVEDAHGQPPTVPFWNGEGLARTAELSDEVCALREALAGFVRRIGAGEPDDAREAIAWIDSECALEGAGAAQALDYVAEGVSALGALPTRRALVAERFFDDSGGMQLILHAPLGARVNRAWGMALRKSFCRSFDFELQAAATDDAVLLSLGPQHSFPLETIFEFVREKKARAVLEQAALQSPLWETRWRWNATRSLAVLRHQGGRRTPPQLLRMKAADLLAAVFPAQAGCQDNHGGGDLELPDHPLVQETMDDCLHEAMDLEGLQGLLRELEAGAISITARDTLAPSVFSHAILNANPYAFLDDAPLEERWTRAVQKGPKAVRGAAGLLESDLLTIDPAAIDSVLAEVASQPRDPDELHDALLTHGYLPERAEQPELREAFAVLRAGRRAVAFVAGTLRGWVATERAWLVRALFPTALFADDVDGVLAELGERAPRFEPEQAAAIVLGAHLRLCGPRTPAELAGELGLDEGTIAIALARFESDGLAIQGRFRPAADGTEWVDRGLLQRIHRRTLGRRRAEVKPISQRDLYRFLLRWQKVAPATQLRGLDGLRTVIEQLEGLELPAAAWERDVLPARVADYDPAWLDQLCLSGEVAWGRLRVAPPDPAAPTRGAGAYGPSGAIALFLRAHGDWLVAPSLGDDPRPASTWEGLSPLARKLAAFFEARGAAFLSELMPIARGEVPGAGDAAEAARLLDESLWQLVRHGVIASDGFDGLRALLARRRGGSAAPRLAIGRWSLIHRDARPRAPDGGALRDGSPVEHAWLYLRRYGIVTRDVLARETLAPSWRELVDAYRRLEARGEIRGGRFVTGVRGEQFALPEALDRLGLLPRAVPDGEAGALGEKVELSAADPLNLLGVLTTGPRCSPLSSERIVLVDGVPREAPTSMRARTSSRTSPTPSPPEADAVPRQV
jgi:ATP-dependent Lhr-like helicase